MKKLNSVYCFSPEIQGKIQWKELNLVQQISKSLNHIFQLFSHILIESHYQIHQFIYTAIMLP